MTARRRRRTAGLAPMIDVVFLLLIFFLLAARGQPALEIPLREAGGDGDSRLWVVDVHPFQVRISGASATLESLAAKVQDSAVNANDLVVVRPREQATVQRMMDTLDALRQVGLRRIAVTP